MLSRLSTTFALAALAIAPTLATALTLDFEDAGYGPLVGLPYGEDVGVSFGGTAFAAIDNDAPIPGKPPGSGDFARAPSPIGAMTMYRQRDSMAGAILNFATGFNEAIDFWFSTNASSATVEIHEGLNGEGRLLASLTLAPLGSDPEPVLGAWGLESGVFNRWEQVELPFEGIARSIVFNGESLKPEDDFSSVAVFFDNITLAPVPEPATYLLMFGGLAAIGAASRRLRVTR